MFEANNSEIPQLLSVPPAGGQDSARDDVCRLKWKRVNNASNSYTLYFKNFLTNIHMFKKLFLKKLIPKSLLNLRHFFYAWIGSRKYNHPSEELVVIGITGTSGKSTTAYILRQILEKLGYTVGSLSTIDFYIAGENKLNDKKMTMLGKMQIQKYLREMVSKGCDIAIVETTSEGRVQHRHRFINYDMMVLTNLYPEHIDSHGSFEKYKKAKLDIFKYVSQLSKKIIKNVEMEKTIVVNGCVEYADEFLSIPFDKKIVAARNDQELFVSKSRFDKEVALVLGTEVRTQTEGISLHVNGVKLSAPMYGGHNVGNILTAIAVCSALGGAFEDIAEALNHIGNAPGRLEFIEEARERGFTVIVDYAFEPKAMEALYAVAKELKPKRIIHVFGSTGGGRDIERRSTVGEFVGNNADICIITDEDPYDDDPQSIIDDVADAVIKSGMRENESLFKILDRKGAIEKAITMAETDDLVLITGKGSEQGMCVGNGKIIPWDDRTVVREALKIREGK
jgi:UDP-N-acetylmuramoyl-L-alanyl-D-glutamate--2,6-diaminopimelate ligase